MRVACFTPLAPSATGVAAYAAALLPEVSRTMEYFVEDTRSFLAHPGWPVFSCRDFARRRRKRPFDNYLYHLGNNPLHLFAYRAALDNPGVIVLHDAVLAHLLLGISWDAWEEEVAYAYGDRGRDIARTLRGGNPATHEGFFRYPLVKRVAERSRAVIVHNQAAAERVRREAPGARVEIVPLPFYCGTNPPATADRRKDRAEARREFALPSDAFLIGCFGYFRAARRLPVALRAWQALRKDGVPNAQFLLAGEFTDPEGEGMLESYLATPGLHRFGHLPDREFDRLAAATDVVVNLRHPSAGESSSIAVRMMGLGLPVVLSELPENAAFPADSCLKVPPDEIEEPLLRKYLLALARNPELGGAIGENAQRYVRREHDLSRAAELYRAVLEKPQT